MHILCWGKSVSAESYDEVSSRIDSQGESIAYMQSQELPTSHLISTDTDRTNFIGFSISVFTKFTDIAGHG